MDFVEREGIAAREVCAAEAICDPIEVLA